jgi:two-component system C4-dicarboxylate transport sensor histidine kinase DctB
VAVTHAADPLAPEGAGARRLTRVLLALVVLGLIVAAAAAAGRLARERAAAELAGRAAAAASLAGASLAAVIEKQRLIPMLLARNPEVIALLAAPVPAPQLRAHLDAELADIAAEADSAVLYVIDRDGVAVAASNAGTPASFVGNDYDFRSYFRGAMAEGSAQQYALGTVSGRPGLYLSRRVESTLGPIGAVVGKVEFDALEARWRDSGLVVQVTDADGVVLATTEPAWRFGSTRPLADEAAAQAALQLGETPLARVPVDFEGGGKARIEGRPFVAAGTAVGPSAPGWRLTVFLPAEPALATAARGAQATALLGGLLVAGVGFAMLRRRRWALARQAALAAMNAELERRVARRTEELNRETAEREAAEGRARGLREELAQANRLSILGQVSAGVAHEINQPLAAIRVYAETGGRLLDAGDAGEARDNLREIVGLTERIGAITQALRGFARRGTGEVRPIAVEEAIDGALALLAGRIRDAGVAIVRTPRAPGIAVMAGRIRLEQILVNLLQNALDAVGEAEAPAVTIGVAAAEETVAVTVADNGPGVAPEAREQLFMPFNTTKETGLGLGLVISGDIAREFGGALRLAPGDGPGAAFTLELPRAA